MLTLSKESRGVLLGLLAVSMFSLNLPFTRVAAQEMAPLFIGLMRCLLASLVAGVLLMVCGSQRPRGREWGQFALCSASLVIGCLFFPLAMRHVSAAHGAVLVGIQPLMTALAACWRNGERPSLAFWGCALLGSLTVIGFALTRGTGSGMLLADLAMLGAVVFCGIGYAEGGRLATRFGGWQTICWALTISGPFLFLPTLWLIGQNGITASPAAWGSLAYISLLGYLLGMYPWYAGMTLGGVAKVGQMQLLQPFMTLALAGLFFGEQVPPTFWLFAGILSVVVWFGRRMPVRRLLEENA
ncbi:MAG: multidrug transporter permease [Proteobacteria bacterium]|nr:multidrug transporter permease [Pseudomonadota bacterium]